MQTIVTEEVNKGGERQARIELYRAQKGLGVNLWASPAMEDCLRAWGDGTQQNVKAHGREWLPGRAGNLLVWQLSQNPGNLESPIGPYRIDLVGRPLIVEDRDGMFGRPARIINLSPLRLCGVSEGSGVSFQLNGVWEEQSIRAMAEQFQQAAKAFYLAFMKPIHVTVTLTTQTTRS